MTGRGRVAFDGANVWVTTGFGTVWKMWGREPLGRCVKDVVGIVNPRLEKSMKRQYWIGIGLSLLLLACVWTLQAQQGSFTTADSASVPPPPLNPNAIAILRWYAANEVTKFNTGCSATQGIAFDGANMWVGCQFDNKVVKVRANDGVVLGKFVLANSPNGIAFDGSNIWVVNGGDVSKLQTSDGKILATFPVGTDPADVTFDGSYIWVSNTLSDNVMKLRVSDGKVVGTFPVQRPFRIAVAGPNVWVSSSAGSVIKLRARDGKQLGSFPMCLPGSLAFDGVNMWIANGECDTVTKLRESDGKTLGTFDSGGIGPIGIAFDSQYIWVANNGLSGRGYFVVKLRLGDGRIVGHFYLQGATEAAFDGSSVWITNGFGYVSKM